MEVNLVSKTHIDQQYLQLLALQSSGGDEQKRLDFLNSVQDLEGLIAYIARVSSSNQTNPSYAGLINYCMSHGHWSILEMGNATFEIKTSRGISPQILRHRSFSFQEFSQRYQSVGDDGIEVYVARRQDKKNRQNSIDDLSDTVKSEWEKRQLENWRSSFEHYKWAIDNEIAKECARMVLPLGTQTKMYMNGTLRSWVHYINLRADAATQKEHRDIAEAIKAEFVKRFPIVSAACGWTE
jgi:thymidylate synthase (FAD)